MKVRKVMGAPVVAALSKRIALAVSAAPHAHVVFAAHGRIGAVLDVH
jgi:hypothetical protein